MRVLCPSCQKLVTVADSSAGQSTACPQCGQAFTPPALTGYSIDSAPPPVVPMPEPRPAPSVSDVPGPSASRATSDGARWVCTLRRDVLRRLTPALLLIAFILSYLTWLAAAPNGTPIYTQNAWKAARGSFTVDILGDEVMAKEAELRKASGWNGWLLLYLIALLVFGILAVADFVVTQMDLTVPDVLSALWPHRSVLIAGGSALMVIALIVPLWTGFGLETAAVAAADEMVPAPQAADGSAPTTRQLQLRDLRRDVAVGAFAIRRTAWLWLALVVQLAAMASAVGAWWLERRDNRPEPRIEFYC